MNFYDAITLIAASIPIIGLLAAVIKRTLKPFSLWTEKLSQAIIDTNKNVDLMLKSHERLLKIIDDHEKRISKFEN